MNVFYKPDFETGQQELFLDKDESRHLGKVLRMKHGDTILITDGKGTLYNAVVADPDSKAAKIQISSVSDLYIPRTYYVHIALAPPKNSDRIEWFVEKAVELGVDEISFIKSSRSERKNINTERIGRVAVSAMKQSLKGKLVKLNDLIKFSDFVTKTIDEEKFIAHLEEGEKVHLFNKVKKDGRYLVLIGPEGDFSPDEILLAKNSGFIPVSLGDYRLRTETAALAACHILNLVNSI